MTLQDVSNHLGVSWDTVKEIHSTYLERHYSPPSLKCVENIGIDEFAVRKGHVYKTIVVDLDSGRVLYVGDGKGADALTKFWGHASLLAAIAFLMADGDMGVSK
jgi:transposase